MSAGNGKNGNGKAAGLEALLVRVAEAQAGPSLRHNAVVPLHPSWEVFIHYCRQLGHGELERVKIQDGLPMMAELATKKVRFSQ